MVIAAELYKQLLSIKLGEKLKGKTLDNLHKINIQVQENLRQESIKEIHQKLQELEKYYEILDFFILSDEEELEVAGSLLLEEFSSIGGDYNKK